MQRMFAFFLMAVLATTGLSACGDSPQSGPRGLVEEAGPCIGCEEVTIELGWMQSLLNSGLTSQSLNMAPNTPVPPDVYVCGTVNDPNWHPGSDCVDETANVVGGVLTTQRTLRVGYIYTVAIWYGGQFRADQLIADFVGGGALTNLIGYIIRGGATASSLGTTGTGAYARVYACLYVDRDPAGNLSLHTYTAAPCDGAIYDYVRFDLTDSQLTVTAGTSAYLQSSFMFDETGVTDPNDSGLQPVINVPWDAGLGLHSFTLYSVPVGIEHWVRAATPQTNPTTGLLVNMDQITIGEVSVNGVVSNPNEMYVHYYNLSVDPLAPDYYAASAAQLTGAPVHIDQPADNRTATIRTP